MHLGEGSSPGSTSLLLCFHRTHHPTPPTFSKEAFVLLNSSFSEVVGSPDESSPLPRDHLISLAPPPPSKRSRLGGPLLLLVLLTSSPPGPWLQMRGWGRGPERRERTGGVRQGAEALQPEGPPGGMFQVWAHTWLPLPQPCRVPDLVFQAPAPGREQRRESEKISVTCRSLDPGAEQDSVLPILDPGSGLTGPLTGLPKVRSGTLGGIGVFTDIPGDPK